ncbi:uncharacterized protein LOC115781137 [Archocentrus centrarchus]|uniref:uncharacterized protein LOC115781137 n=1 Tax=Archocentrus centrarchus TaxID=63155 RepID=UPI0011E9B3CA|nr:uncharacterized protein LOC115781137 [Archocentrus centrarchus]
MTERLQRLKQKRTVLRASVTKLLQNIQDETSKSNVNSDHLQELLAMLSQKEKSLQDIEPGIEQEIALEELDADLMRTMEYQDNTSLWRTRAERAIERAAIQQLEPGGDAAIETRPQRLSDASTRSTASRPSVKLPKLSISKYNGEVCMWQEFWDQFENAIHRNPDLSKTERFTYLKSYLIGPAARAVAGLKMLQLNPQQAERLPEQGCIRMFFFTG